MVNPDHPSSEYLAYWDGYDAQRAGRHLTDLDWTKYVGIGSETSRATELLERGLYAAYEGEPDSRVEKHT